jgi:hypothetical protein
MEKIIVWYCLNAISVAFHCSAKKANNVFPSQKCRFLPISPNCPQRPSGREGAPAGLRDSAGRLDELKASGRLEALIRSGLRHCEKFALIDAHAAGDTQAVTVQRIGPDLVFGRL